MLTTEKRLTERYGDPYNKAAFQAKNILTWTLPEWMREIWPPYDGKPVRRISLNRAIIPHLEAVMSDLIAKDLVSELETYNGAYIFREQRGSKSLSLHSFGIALDFNSATNRLGGTVTFSAAFLAVWRAHGWTCGADFNGSRVDGMHFEYTKTA